MIYYQVFFIIYDTWRLKTNIFLETLKKELENQQLTQKKLAEDTQISVNTIRGWFAKNLVPDVFTAVKIAKALNTSVEFLVTGEESRQDVRELQELKAKYDALALTIKGIASTL